MIQISLRFGKQILHNQIIRETHSRQRSHASHHIRAFVSQCISRLNVPHHAGMKHDKIILDRQQLGKSIDLNAVIVALTTQQCFCRDTQRKRHLRLVILLVMSYVGIVHIILQIAREPSRTVRPDDQPV